MIVGARHYHHVEHFLGADWTLKAGHHLLQRICLLDITSIPAGFVHPNVYILVLVQI